MNLLYTYFIGNLANTKKLSSNPRTSSPFGLEDVVRVGVCVQTISYTAYAGEGTDGMRHPLLPRSDFGSMVDKDAVL